MEVKEIKEKNIWENFLKGIKEKTFLQSWNWGEFNKLMGNKIWRLGIFDREELIGTALVSKITAKRGIFLLIQHGPVIKPKTKAKEVLEVLLNELKKIGKEEKAVFIRMNPLWPARRSLGEGGENNTDNQKIFKELGFRESPMHANAYETTLKLDLSLSEEELLGKMRKTTRYLIKQALLDENITIEKSEKAADVELYEKLNLEIAKKQKFVPFSLEYIKNEFEIFSRENQTLLLFGKYQGEIAAAALVIFWSGIGFYHQAASDPKYAKFSIPYLILWEAIKEAKNRGCILYNFWGYVDPKLKPRHPWAGPTLFKMGFGGQPYEYVKTQDFSLSKKYWLTFIFEKIRKIKRGL